MSAVAFELVGRSLSRLCVCVLFIQLILLIFMAGLLRITQANDVFLLMYNIDDDDDGRRWATMLAD